MERKKSKIGKKSKGKNPSQNLSVSATALAFNGPIRSEASKEELDVVETTINFTGQIASTAGAIIDSQFSDDPSSYAVTDWTNFAGTWHEYRSLGIRVEFHPYNRYSKTTTICTPFIVVADRATSGTLGSYQAAMDHASATKHSIEDPWVKEIRMNGTEEATWKSTAGPTATKWIKFYADGLSVSTTYGRFFVYNLIQGRGRK